MTNVFEYTEYREFLLVMVEGHRERRGTNVQLAKAMDCQAAYFSQVLSGKAELTEDQGLKLCQYLKMSALETEYFLVILRQARAATQVLVQYLEEKRKEILHLHNEIEGRIASDKNSQIDEMNIYYSSSWIPSVIHVATSCEAYQSVEAIAKRVGLEKPVIEFHLKTLEKYGLVKFEKSHWVYQGKSTHFVKGSLLDQAFQMSRRLLAMNSLLARDTHDIHYSVVFSMNERTAKKVRELFLSSIENLHKIAEPSPSEEIYTLCLDYFKV